jgi:hypothetical protein
MSRALLVLTLLCWTTAAAAWPQQAGGVSASGTKVRVVRVASGSRGSEVGGRFAIEDPRTVFSSNDDKEALVYFEWEGTTGQHRFEGIWRNPSGQIEVITRFEFEAKDKRFGGFWKLPLSPAMATGLWALEARVDGELAGGHTIEIGGGPVPASAVGERVKILSAAEIYRLFQQAIFTIDALDGAGTKINAGLGFLLPDVGLVTALQVIDGASSVRVTAPDGTVTVVDRLLALARERDLAVLDVPPGMRAVLKPAGKGAGQVGDRVFTLAAGEDGLRTLLDVAISGTSTKAPHGERFSLNNPSTRSAAGAPILNDAGDVLGVLGGEIVPGAATVRQNESVSLRELLGYPAMLWCVPHSSLPSVGTAATSFADLTRTGQFTAPLGAGRRHVATGVAAQNVQRDGGWVRAIGQNTRFSKAAGSFWALVNLSPQVKLRSRGTFRVFARDGTRVCESTPLKVNVDLGRTLGVAWAVDCRAITGGMYRIDFDLDGAPVWRVFVEIVP